MKKTFQLALVAVFLTAALAVQLRAQDSNLGLTVGIDYVSSYIKNGQYHFLHIADGDAFIVPYVFFDVFKTGFSLGIKAELPEAWLGDANENSREAYYTAQQRSIDFNVDYKYSFADIATVNLGVWYYRYKTNYFGENNSYFDYYLSIAADALPLTPTVNVLYSYYTNHNWVRGYEYYYDSGNDNWEAKIGNGKNEDVYIQLVLSHSFDILETTSLDLGAAIAFYNKRTSEPKSFDISDIDLSAGITTNWGRVTFTGSFHYIIVPGTQFKNSYEYPIDHQYDIKDIHRSYIKLGAAYSF